MTLVKSTFGVELHLDDKGWYRVIQGESFARRTANARKSGGKGGV